MNIQESTPIITLFNSGVDQHKIIFEKYPPVNVLVDTDSTTKTLMTLNNITVCIRHERV